MTHRHNTALGIIVALALTTLLGGCKPSEKSYREAYNTAIQARNAANADILGSDTEARMQTIGRPLKTVVTTPQGVDTLHYQQGYATATSNIGGQPARSKRYCVIVGKFKQIFNAKEMRKRLIDLGHDNAMVLSTNQSAYIVSADMTDQADSALTKLRAMQADKNLGLKPPYPYVLRTN